MNRGEFLAGLRAQLADFSEEAREDALKFYEEYLDEAGPENEAVVLAELGSPQKVARIIRANCDSGMPQERKSTARTAARHPLSGASWRAPRAPMPPRPDFQDGPQPAGSAAGAETGPAAQEGAAPDGIAPDGIAPEGGTPENGAWDGSASNGGASNGGASNGGASNGGAPNRGAPEDGAARRRPAYDYSAHANGAYRGGYGGTDGQAGQSGRDRTLWIILIVVTCPLWIGAIGGLIGGAFGLVGGMIGLFFGGIGTIIAGFAALGGGVGLLFTSAPSGILMIGLSLLCVACGALLSAAALWVITKLVPLAVRGVRWLWNRLFGNGR